MKKFLFSCIIAFFTISNSVLLPQNYFPAVEGDSYQYYNEYVTVGGPGGGGSSQDYGSYIIGNDTLINGEIYSKLISNRAIGLSTSNYYRFDSLNQKLFVMIPGDSLERLAVDFSLPADSTFISYIRTSPLEFKSQGTSYKNVLGDSVLTYSMRHDWSYNDYVQYFTYEFADGFGLSYYLKEHIEGTIGITNEANIISAIINGISFNEFTLTIDTLYPLIDRPRNAVPFVVYSSYSSPVPGLINSFNLYLHHYRDSLLIQEYEYPFEAPWYSVNVNIPDLEAGDKLQLKAVCRDSSIYNNLAVYPDSGWAYITILPEITSLNDPVFPEKFQLYQNYPNPFNPTTKIKWQVPEDGHHLLEVYDIIGNKILTLVDEFKVAGSYEIEFSSTKLASGVYIYKFASGRFINTKKMIVTK